MTKEHTEEEPQKDAVDQEPAAQAKKEDETKNEEPQTFSLEYVQDLRKEAAANRVALKELQEKEQERAEEERKRQEEEAQKKGEFEKLYTTAKDSIANLTGERDKLKEQAEAYEAIFTAQWEARKEQIPEIFHSLLEPMSIQDRLQWLDENKEKLSLNGAGGVKPTPQANGRQVDTAASKTAQQRMAAIAKRRF